MRFLCAHCGATPGRPCVTWDGGRAARSHLSRRRQAGGTGGPVISPAQAAALRLAEETRILELLANGYFDLEICRALDMAERTYRRRLSDLLVRLGARTRTQAVAIWLGNRHGLTGQPAPLTREAQPA